MIKLAACVVLYNPDDTIFENILTYGNYVDKLIVIDNSLKKNNFLIDKLNEVFESKLIYINNNDNLGIATALNQACDKAIELQFKWILTMDQDSSFVNFSHYKKCLEKVQNVNNVALLAANTDKEGYSTFDRNECSCNYREDKFSVITSANIVNLEYFEEIGRFNDKLFIDKYASVIKNKKANKKALQESLGLEVDDHKIVIGLISRLTNQKGLDLVNDVIPSIMDEHTQVVVLGTGDTMYEDAFRYYENKYKGNFCAYIAYNENVAHNIYAGCDSLLVPSRFEPCGLTQLIAMRYGAVPIVRETGGLKDTVQPYNMFENTGNGFTFDRYESGLLYDAINRAKTLYFENRVYWDDMVVRDMNKDVSWEQSAKQYKDMYVELTPKY